MSSSTSRLPRSDVSTGALAGALVGILMLVLNGGTTAAALAPLLTVCIHFGVEYAFPRMKREAGAIAGALVVVGVGAYSLIVGLAFDGAAFNSAAVYLVTLVLTFALPAVQPGEPRMGRSR